MRFLFPVTLLLLVGTMIYLIVDHGSEPASQTTNTEAQELRTESLKPRKLRTPHLVRTLIDPSAHIADQIESIRNLPTDLTDGEFAALIDFLYQEAPNGIRSGTWSTLQNEIMEVLRTPRFHHWSGYASAMTKLLLDRHANPIMRDYAAQHLVLHLSESQSPSYQSVDSIFSLFTSERDLQEQVVGTTLMALCDLNRTRPELIEPHQERLAQTITTLVSGQTHTTLPNRISAIQAAGRLTIWETLPDLRQIVTGSSSSETFPNALRPSAITALGYFASPEDEALLQQLASGPTKLRFAAQSALKNFSN